MKFARLAALATFLAVPALAGQGVGDKEVVIGSVSDLSGPFAAFGAPAVRAAQMHFTAVNAAGGVHGRKIRFVVEDSSYQMPKALQGYNKLVNRDKVFAMLLSLGTPMNIAGYKLMTPKNIPNVFPLSSARQILSEPIRLRFAGASFYYDELRQAA
ncbi:MAG: ABC transporter substrate-binding protein, partial [Defluviicoccus sp.]|nr:ABC transporter substrate-binding protein [Defluviicoccus sp.]